MKNELENLSKQALLELLSSRDSEINSLSQEKDTLLKEREYLKAQIEMYKRMQFGQKRERFEANPDQMALPFEVAVEKAAEQEAIIEEKITYQRKRPNHKGRAKLPSHLDVEEIEIFPQEDLSEMVCIGKEITEELECQPARFYVKRYIRYKYAAKNREGVVIGELPQRVIDKGIPGAGLLSMILTDKYVDHLPLYHQKQRFSRENIQTINHKNLKDLNPQNYKKIAEQSKMQLVGGIPSPEDAPRGMEFLYSPNRFNVAVSRAKAVFIMVGSPNIFEPDCKSPEQIKLANPFCRFMEITK